MPCFILSALLSVLVSYLNFFFFFFGLSLFLGQALVQTRFSFFSSSLPSSFFGASSSSPGLENPDRFMPTVSIMTVVYLSSSTYSSSWLIGSGSGNPVNSSSASSSSSSLDLDASLISPFACLTNRFTSLTCFSRSSFRCCRNYSNRKIFVSFHCPIICKLYSILPRFEGRVFTSRLNRNFSSFSRFAFSSCACFMRATLRLWKPVRYSSRAAGSKDIVSGAGPLLTTEESLRLFGGGAMLIAVAFEYVGAVGK